MSSVSEAVEMKGRMKVAVVTAYLNESEAVLRRCHESVLAQTYEATHFFVADGGHSAEIATWDVHHITLPRPHNDGGDTPRAIGAISALNQGFDAIAFLDADNWFAPDHIETCVETCIRENVDVAFASRRIVLSTGQVCPFDDRDSFEKRHVDTSCFFVTKRAAFVLPLWGMIDPAVWKACDRIMFATVKARNVSHAWTERRTVFYTSHWGLHFRAMNLPVPSDEHQIDWDEVNRSYDREALVARFGFDPEIELNRGNDHVVVDQDDALDYLNRVVFFSEPALAEIEGLGASDANSAPFEASEFTGQLVRAAR